MSAMWSDHSVARTIKDFTFNGNNFFGISGRFVTRGGLDGAEIA